MGLLGSYAVKFTGDLSGLTNSFSEAEKKTSDFREKMKAVGKEITEAGKAITMTVSGPILALGAGLIALGIKTGNYADKLLDLRDATGISTDRLQQFRLAEVAAGVSTDTISSSIIKMSQQMVSSTEYSAKLTAAAAKYGVALRDQNGNVRDASEVHTDMMKALSDIVDPQERARAGAQAFGRDWAEVAPVVGLGREAIEKLYNTPVISVENLNASNEFRVKIDQMKDSLNQAALGAGTALMPILNDLAGALQDSLVPILNVGVSAFKTLAEWFNKIPGPGKIIIGVFIALLAALGPLILGLGFFVSTMLPALALGFTTAGTVATAAWTAITGPVGLVILAIATVVAAVILIHKNWDTVKYAAEICFAYLKIGAMYLALILINAAEIMFMPWIAGINAVIKGFNYLTKSSIPTISELVTAVKDGIEKQITAENKKLDNLKASRVEQKQLEAEEKLALEKKKADNNAVTANVVSNNKEQIKSTQDKVAAEAKAGAKETADNKKELNKRQIDGAKYVDSVVAQVDEATAITGEMVKSTYNDIQGAIGTVLDSILNVFSNYNQLIIDANNDYYEKKLAHLENEKITALNSFDYSADLRLKELTANSDYTAYMVEKEAERYNNMTYSEQTEYNLKKQYDEDLLAEQNKIVAERIALENTQNAAILAAQEKREKENRRLKRQAAISERIAASFTIAVSTASAIMQAFGQLGPIGGAISAAIIGTLAVVQTALVWAKPLPPLAEGGLTTGAAIAQIGEGKYQEAILPLSSDVFSMLAQGIVDKIGSVISGGSNNSSALSRIKNSQSSTNSSNSSSVTIQAGVIVADEGGLKKLERMLSTIRIGENMRKGLVTV